MTVAPGGGYCDGEKKSAVAPRHGAHLLHTLLPSSKLHADRRAHRGGVAIFAQENFPGWCNLPTLTSSKRARPFLPMNFTQLTAVAAEVVARAQRRLPPAVRAVAAAVPVCYEPMPNEAIQAEGWEPDILGLFIGDPHGAQVEAGAQGLPPQILLFLENLWHYAEGDESIYRDEVRLTYLHELGHYLGWDEEDVADRGLE